MQYAINARGLVKSYHTKACAVPVLSGVNLCVPCGAFVSIAGPSGCGKSTLLSILGCLDLADAGELSLLGQDVMNASEHVLCTLRREQLGFVFQSYNLVPSLSALSNVELPLKYRGVPAVLRRELALAALCSVGLFDRREHLPGALSGGQQQRVAVARALAATPKLLLADEPTGNLDPTSAAAVMDAIAQLHEGGTAVVMITHDAHLAAAAPLRFQLANGVLQPVS